jgi:hypothetical protein
MKTYVQRPMVVATVVHTANAKIASVVELKECCRGIEPLIDEMPAITPTGAARDRTDTMLVQILTMSPVHIGHDGWWILRLFLCS